VVLFWLRIYTAFFIPGYRTCSSIMYSVGSVIVCGLCSLSGSVLANSVCVTCGWRQLHRRWVDRVRL